MYTVKNSAEFLSALTGLDERLKDLKLSSVEVDKEKSSVTYNFICDKAVDAAFFAQGLLRARKGLWQRLPEKTRRQTVDALVSSRTTQPWENNWLLFAGEIEGRTSDEDITIFESLGLAAEDLAAAKYLMDK